MTTFRIIYVKSRVEQTARRRRITHIACTPFESTSSIPAPPTAGETHNSWCNKLRGGIETDVPSGDSLCADCQKALAKFVARSTIRTP